MTSIITWTKADVSAEKRRPSNFVGLMHCDGTFNSNDADHKVSKDYVLTLNGFENLILSESVAEILPSFKMCSVTPVMPPIDRYEQPPSGVPRPPSGGYERQVSVRDYVRAFNRHQEDTVSCDPRNRKATAPIVPLKPRRSSDTAVFTANHVFINYDAISSCECLTVTPDMNSQDDVKLQTESYVDDVIIPTDNNIDCTPLACCTGDANILSVCSDAAVVPAAYQKHIPAQLISQKYQDIYLTEDTLKNSLAIDKEGICTDMKTNSSKLNAIVIKDSSLDDVPMLFTNDELSSDVPMLFTNDELSSEDCCALSSNVEIASIMHHEITETCSFPISCSSRPLVLASDEQRSSVAGVDEQRPSLAGVGEQRPSLAGVGEQRPSLAGVGELRPSLVGVGELHPSLAGVGEQHLSLAGICEQRPSLAFVGEQRPSLAGVGEQSASVGDSLPPTSITAVGLSIITNVAHCTSGEPRLSVASLPSNLMAPSAADADGEETSDGEGIASNTHREVNKSTSADGRKNIANLKSLQNESNATQNEIPPPAGSVPSVEESSALNKDLLVGRLVTVADTRESQISQSFKPNDFPETATTPPSPLMNVITDESPVILSGSECATTSPGGVSCMLASDAMGGVASETRLGVCDLQLAAQLHEPDDGLTLDNTAESERTKVFEQEIVNSNELADVSLRIKKIPSLNENRNAVVPFTTDLKQLEVQLITKDLLSEPFIHAENLNPDVKGGIRRASPGTNSQVPVQVIDNSGNCLPTEIVNPPRRSGITHTADFSPVAGTSSYSKIRDVNFVDQPKENFTKTNFNNFKEIPPNVEKIENRESSLNISSCDDSLQNCADPPVNQTWLSRKSFLRRQHSTISSGSPSGNNKRQSRPVSSYSCDGFTDGPNTKGIGSEDLYGAAVRQLLRDSIKLVSMTSLTSATSTWYCGESNWCSGCLAMVVRPPAIVANPCNCG